MADTASINDADDLGTLSYQLLRDGVTISGANSATYDLTSEDQLKNISVQINYTDGHGRDETMTSTQSVVEKATGLEKTGTNGTDEMIGGYGNDILDGAAGNDHIEGGAGGDQLFGGLGNDVVIGGDGKDIISGGSGENILSGGQGADQFIFDGLTGTNTITDFEIGTDQINFHSLFQKVERLSFDLNGVGFGRSACFVDYNIDSLSIRFEQNGNNTEIYVEYTGVINSSVNAEPSVTLENVNMTTLAFDDFFF